MNRRLPVFSPGLRRLPALMILSLVLSPAAHPQAALNTSPALGALIRQADQTFARPVNVSIQDYFNRIPVNAAVILGLAMHGQKRIADRDPLYLWQYEALQQEAHEFLGELARVHNFTNPYDGTPMGRDLLVGIFDSNASGEQNQWAVRNGLPDPSFVEQPLILNLVTPESLGRLHLRSDANEIRLLDQAAPPVPSPEPFPAPNLPPATRHDPQKQSITPAAVVGSWQLTTDCSIDATKPRGDLYLEFRRGVGRDLYVGVSSGGGDTDTFRITSENQRDPYSVEFTAVWENPRGQAAYLVHGKTIKITMFRGRFNQLLLCRGGAGGVMSSGYLKRGY